MRKYFLPLKAKPHCKINLGLHITGRREDGYHNIETIFLPIHALSDTLEIVDSDTPRIELDGIPLDTPPEDNICFKAWQLLHDKYGVPPVCIRLNKRIPFGAGLGGGSSDAAFTLKLLNQKYLGLSDPILTEHAKQLGADCPFFIRNRVAYATGIGDNLKRLRGFSLRGYRIVIEMPEGEHISTKEAYQNLDTSLFNIPRPDLCKAVKQPVEEWRNLIINDFEASVFPAHPAVANLKEDMYRRGAVYASMSGSGAAVFGIFPSNR
ncbi:MAG: 4-(cytidine 5'-diphospho)-2-C-methyl-D-erythritol kinase [Bacteroidales bacterium]|nr:4-(cytidine 5'-diphospho)-2-C-methyl-D-erythritol kinase [Bacteroidales bacterium]